MVRLVRVLTHLPRLFPASCRVFRALQLVHVHGPVTSPHRPSVKAHAPRPVAVAA